jgi:hypothetical protein
METVDPTNIDKMRQVALKFKQAIPQIQRTSLLANPQGLEQGMPALGANAIAGPYGAVMTTAVEAILKDDPRGWPLLQMAWNPAKFVKGWYEQSDEAWQALARGEEGRAANMASVDPHSIKDKMLHYPGQVMTMGDIYARKLLQQAGFSAEEAMTATLTSEPGKGWRQLANVGKGNMLMQLMFPFRRTPVNIMEQGIRRLPLGRLVAPKGQATNEMIAEQGLGTIAGLANYALASNIEDDATRRNVRRMSSNMGGRYSLPSMIGYMLGDANANDQTVAQAISNERNANSIFPLPTTDVPIDIAKKLWKLVSGDGQLSDLAPESMKFKPLRQWLGDRAPQLRDELGVQPPPSRGVRRRSARPNR